MVLFIFLLSCHFLVDARQGKNKVHSFLHTLRPSDDSNHEQFKFIFKMFLIKHNLLSYCCLCFLCSSETHFLRYKFAALYKANTHHVFSAVCVCDDRQIAQYSNEERVMIRARLTADDWINAPNEPPESRDWFMHQLNSLSNSTDSQSSGGFHALFINYQTCYEIACICGQFSNSHC